MTVIPERNEVYAVDWTKDTEVTLTIEDPDTLDSPDYTDTKTVGDHPFSPGGTWVQFFPDTLQIEPDQVVSMTDGVTTKEHTVTLIQITEIDLESDTMSGIADPGRDVTVGINGVPPPHPETTADEAGNWTVMIDLEPGMSGMASVPDNDGDQTGATFLISNPLVSAFLQPNQVEGFDWPLETDITLEVDDPATQASPDYTDIETTEPFVHNPDAGYVFFDLGEFELQPGFEVTLTDGVNTRTHTVLDLSVTSINADTDRVSGMADPGSDITVSIWVETGPMLDVTADGDGKWTADFSGVYDIAVGDQGSVSEADAAGHTTVIVFTTPEPPEFIKGDANGDDVVDTLDALTILRYVAGMSHDGVNLPDAGDVDCDGDVDAVDALNVLRYVAGMEVVLPPGCPPIGQ